MTVPSGIMASQSFEDLRVWQKSVDLNIAVYKIFSKINEQWVTHQILRSSLSVPSNIAEGYNRETNKEFIRYLYIARGSCAEVQTQLFIASRLGLINKVVSDELLESSKSIILMLSKLISVRKTQFK